MALFWGEGAAADGRSGHDRGGRRKRGRAERSSSRVEPALGRKSKASLTEVPGEHPALGWITGIASRLAGVGAFVVGLALAAALLSYDAADPSLLTATGRAPSNWLGTPGAMLADPLIQGLGLAAWGLIGLLAVWGWRLAFRQGDERFWGRLIVMPPALGAGAIFAALIVPWDGWPVASGLGGVLGDRGAAALIHSFPMAPAEAFPWIAAGSGLVAVVLGALALGLSLSEGRAILSWMAGSLSSVAGEAARGAMGGIASLRGVDREDPRPRSERLGPARPTGRARRVADPETLAHVIPKPAGEEAAYAHAPTEEDYEADGRPGLFGLRWFRRQDDGDMATHADGVENTGSSWRPRFGRLLSFGRSAGEDDGQAAPVFGAAPAHVTYGGRGPEPVLASLAPSARSGSGRGDAQARSADPSSLVTAIRSLTADDAGGHGGIERDHPDAWAEGDPGPAPAFFRHGAGDGADEAYENQAFEPEGDDDPTLDLGHDGAPRRPNGEGPANPLASFARAARKRTQPAPRSRRAEAESQPSLFATAPGHEPYEPPALSLLARPVAIGRPTQSQSSLEENARMLETVLEDYGVRGEIVAVKPGPVVTLYELEPAPGLKASRVIGLADDIARSMSALSARIATVPGRSVIGIELPNTEREKVWLRETLESRPYGDARYPLALALGKDIEGEPVIANLAKMPHLLIAGTTGSGKSVAINTMILSLLYRLSPEQCRLIMIDPKMLELSVYDNIPHLLAPVVTDPKKAVVALKWVVAEMEERYRRMSKLGVRNIDGYNARCRDTKARGELFSRTIQTGFDESTGEPVYETQEFEPEEMPLIVVIVDEMADLMMVAGKEIEACIQRLAQMARASGIHLIMATQRPSVDVITGTIK
ncbi:MAG: DNA translocase FtsK 4TM domain-containing protein, partial [Pseudomonadota bacterium]